MLELLLKLINGLFQCKERFVFLCVLQQLLMLVLPGLIAPILLSQLTIQQSALISAEGLNSWQLFIPHISPGMQWSSLIVLIIYISCILYTIYLSVYQCGLLYYLSSWTIMPSICVSIIVDYYIIW